RQVKGCRKDTRVMMDGFSSPKIEDQEAEN
ncbi:hypothetical protein HKBW3C_01821, partial [Candidatus Hakubella thermalkaliphila]